MRLNLGTIKDIFLRAHGKTFPQGMPSFSQWRMLPSVMNKKERRQFLLFVGCFFTAGIILCVGFYLRHTIIIPKYGGEYIEGVVGQPRYINPIYGIINDTDRDLVQLVFSGLMTYDANGQIIPDLAESYEISDDGTIYNVRMKDNLYWTDDVKLTADDVVYTINTIQDPEYKSPLRAGLIGVEVKKISENEIRFVLKNPYASFLENLTVKILPRHIWESITPQNFPLSSYNLSPIGSGPYQLIRVNRDKDDKIQSLMLIANKKYHRKKPYIEKLTIKFFDNENTLIGAVKKNSVQGYSLPYPTKQGNENNFQSYNLAIPRYFSLFMNSSKILAFSDLSVRQALNYATDKQGIIDSVLGGKGQLVDSPIMPEIYGFAPTVPIYGFDQEKAGDILEKQDIL
ncbi:MAG: ABC transporter substrate-binding protein [bacterium]